MQKTISIHQPNFFPWLGYFHKIMHADVFIFLDDAQFPKKGGSWSNRVKLLMQQETKWLTAPICRNYHGTKSIAEMQFNATEWRHKCYQSLKMHYGNHLGFRETIDMIKPLLLSSEESISKYNSNAIIEITKRLGINAEKFRHAQDAPTNATGTQRLCDLVAWAQGDRYLCGGGSDGYLEPELFDSHGIKLEMQQFEHPTYPQRNTEGFVAGLSIIDAFMNLGIEGTGELLRSR